MAQSPRPSDDDPDIADASFLLGREPSPGPASGGPRPQANSPVGAGGYDFADDQETDEAAPPSPPVPIGSPAAPRAERRPKRREPRAEPDSRVDEVWSRGAEWGPTITLLAVVATGLLVVLYLASGALEIGTLFLIALGGLVLLVALAYPLFITLERPVRMTPEQAARDFYGALSHRWPHYRRMWLLLSTPGRSSGPFESFAGFRTYWKGRVATLRSEAAKGAGPLEFRVQEFKSEKSAGKSFIDGRYTVAVVAKSKEAETTVDTFRADHGFVKGPDNQWYLDQGILPVG